jgi:hypothetical protein
LLPEKELEFEAGCALELVWMFWRIARPLVTAEI